MSPWLLLLCCCSLENFVQNFVSQHTFTFCAIQTAMATPGSHDNRRVSTLIVFVIDDVLAAADTAGAAACCAPAKARFAEYKRSRPVRRVGAVTGLKGGLITWAVLAGALLLFSGPAGLTVGRLLVLALLSMGVMVPACTALITTFGLPYFVCRTPRDSDALVARVTAIVEARGGMPRPCFCDWQRTFRDWLAGNPEALRDAAEACLAQTEARNDQ